MDTIDRSNTNLPAPVPTNLSLLRDLTPALPFDQAGSPGLQVNPRVILRGLSRHWWRILALWLVVSAPILFYFYQFIKPTFEASSLVKIEPVDPQLFTAMYRGENQSSTYLKTEVAVLTSDKVLEPVVANALVGNLPIIKMSQDPKNDLHERLKVGILENTNLIRIALELPNRNDAVTIVQAVVQSYFEQNSEISRFANRNLTGSLEEQVKRLGEQIVLKREALKTLYKKGKVAVLKPQDRLNVNANNDGNAIEPTIKTYSENHVQQMMAGMVPDRPRF